MHAPLPAGCFGMFRLRGCSAVEGCCHSERSRRRSRGIPAVVPAGSRVRRAGEVPLCRDLSTSLSLRSRGQQTCHSERSRSRSRGIPTVLSSGFHANSYGECHASSGGLDFGACAPPLKVTAGWSAEYGCVRVQKTPARMRERKKHGGRNNCDASL